MSNDGQREEDREGARNERRVSVTGIRLMPWKLLTACWIAEGKIKRETRANSAAETPARAFAHAMKGGGTPWHPIIGTARRTRAEAGAITAAIGRQRRAVVRDDSGQVYLERINR